MSAIFVAGAVLSVQKVQINPTGLLLRQDKQSCSRDLRKKNLPKDKQLLTTAEFCWGTTKHYQLGKHHL